MRIYPSILLLFMSSAVPTLAEEKHQPYAGHQSRDIAALSAADIAELKAGRGWGLALAAELNGYPGPAHVLELTDELALSATQRAEVTDIFSEMQADAIKAGNALITAERALGRAFAEGTIDADLLKELVKNAAEARGNLRFVHLSRHLQTIRVLNAGQIERYNVHRGYAPDPCASVPDGHDASMWRQHNGCDD